MSNFFLYALLGGFGVALMAGPLGSFIVWRRMAYFGDALAHSALLGAALGLLLQMHLTLTIVLVCAGIAGLLVLFQRESRFSSDTLLGILAHGALSLGLVCIALMPGLRVDVNAYLFGDILAIGKNDIIAIYALAAAIFTLLHRLWRPLLMMTIHEDIARVEGIRAERVRLALMLMLAFLVAVSIKIVGMLMITSLLIIPASAARYFARVPSQMMALAVFFGILAVALGLWGSYRFDTPSGPSIVLAALGIFVAAYAVRGRKSTP